MKTGFFRLVSLALATATGLTAAPTSAADATLGEQASVAMTDAERWPLRPSKVSAAALISPRSKTIALSDLPNERRSVRVVYQGYGEALPPLRPSR